MARELKFEQPFDLGLSVTMGQAFRWYELPLDFYGDGDKWFSGVLGESLVHIRQTDASVEYRVGGPDGEWEATLADDEMLRRYFREDDDVIAIYSDISRDSAIARLVEQYCGMRVLRQEPWECTVAYICSANNNIRQISSIVERVAAEFGNSVELNGDARCLFPPPERLAQDDAESGLDSMNLGLRRAANTVSVARSVSSGALDLYALRSESYARATVEIRDCPGVGNKIADCIALFSLDKLEAFPVDVHIGRALAEWADCPFPQDTGRLADRQYARIGSWARQHFGPFAGYAGQFMFCDREQSGNVAASDALSKKVEGTAGKLRTAPEHNASRHPNRDFPCSKCGAAVGQVCRYPSGYRYERGHSERGPRR
ncbi:MAG: DNA glycosylase [Chloroflexota bacterium]|nr:DNA glycosylase [Chloroflexota bacterium]MDE2962068.1 DNA glycosylase [Chloroflexota bacterium]